jgi:RNA polymerase sigma-70 factor, ECF subfamily
MNFPKRWSDNVQGLAPIDADDRSLVTAALQDRQAYGALIRRYEVRLARYVRRLLGRYGQMTEDVLQDGFIRGYVNLNDYDLTRPFSPWIYRIMHNEAVSFLRKQRAGIQTIAGEEAQLIIERIAADDTPEMGLQRSQSAADIRAALESLEQRYRDVLVLRYLEEMSYDEIADVLEMPPGTVATNLSRGLKQLQTPRLRSWITT